jgi:GH35 family endo-1,4-beta-xylanase
VRGQYDFTDADRLVDFAALHGQSVRGHTLVWHLSLPDWLTSGGLDAAEVRSILKGHIETTMTRYRGRIAVWDVVRRVAALDLDVAITELDVLVPVPADALSLRQQAEVYGGAAQACLSTPRCRSITVWGFTDAVSWIPA